MKKGDIFRVRLVAEVEKKATTPKSILKRRIKVRAPRDLEEGYLFSTVVKGSTIKSTIPKGGVKKGDIFTIPYIPKCM